MKTLLLLVALSGITSAQTATFTFGALPSPFSQNQGRCTDILSWNGIAATDPNNPFPQNMGGICLAIYPAVYTDIYPPWQLGFPNNGSLTQCAPTVWQPIVNNGNGTGTGGFTSSGCYDGGNTVISATVNYKDVTITYCGRGGCHTFHAWQVVGGSGTVVNE